jgi:hypothetical protein
MTIIEIKRFRSGWQVYGNAGVLSVFLDQHDAIDYATGQEANEFSSARVSRARRHQSLRRLNDGDDELENNKRIEWGWAR